MQSPLIIKNRVDTQKHTRHTETTLNRFYITLPNLPLHITET